MMELVWLLGRKSRSAKRKEIRLGRRKQGRGRVLQLHTDTSLQDVCFTPSSQARSYSRTNSRADTP